MKLAISLLPFAHVNMLAGQYTNADLLCFFPWRHTTFRTAFDVTAAIGSLMPDTIIFYGDTSLQSCIPEGVNPERVFYFNDMDEKHFVRASKSSLTLAPSASIADLIRENVNAHVLPCLPAVPKILYPGIRDPDLGGVYMCGLLGSEEFRNFAYLADRCKESGIPLWLYHGGAITEDISFEYETRRDAIIRRLDSYGTLLDQIQRHDWAYCGCAIACPDCMTNKMFEAIAAGVPIMVENMRDQESFVLDHNIGVVVSDSNMPRWAATDIRKRLADTKYNFCSEVVNRVVLEALVS